jgi:hypothetical protein
MLSRETPPIDCNRQEDGGQCAALALQRYYSPTFPPGHSSFNFQSVRIGSPEDIPTTGRSVRNVKMWFALTPGPIVCESRANRKLKLQNCRADAFVEPKQRASCRTRILPVPSGQH